MDKCGRLQSINFNGEAFVLHCIDSGSSSSNMLNELRYLFIVERYSNSHFPHKSLFLYCMARIVTLNEDSV